MEYNTGTDKSKSGYYFALIIKWIAELRIIAAPTALAAAIGGLLFLWMKNAGFLHWQALSVWMILILLGVVAGFIWNKSLRKLIHPVDLMSAEMRIPELDRALDEERKQREFWEKEGSRKGEE